VAAFALTTDRSMILAMRYRSEGTWRTKAHYRSTTLADYCDWSAKLDWTKPLPRRERRGGV